MKNQVLDGNTGFLPENPGSNHSCCLYRDPVEVADIVVPFLKSGIADGNYCCLITAVPEDVTPLIDALRAVLPDTDSSIEKGQLDVISHRDWYLSGSVFKPQNVRFRLRRRLDEVTQSGVSGITIVQDMAGFTKSDCKKVLDYERLLDADLRGVAIRSLCLYPLDMCENSIVLDIISYHDHAYVYRNGAWLDLKNSQRDYLTEMLEESEERYRVLFGSMQGGVFVVDATTLKILLANHALADMFGVESPDQLTGLNPLDFIADEDKKRALETIVNQVFDNGLQDSVEFQAITRDGRDIWIRVLGMRTIYEGKLAGVVSVWDVTQQKRAEQLIGESEAKFSVAFRSSPDLIAITSLPEGRYVDVNDNYLRITGYEKEELIGKRSRDIDMWAYPRERTRMMRLIRTHGKYSGEEFHFRMKSGEIRTWLHSAEPVTINGQTCLLGVGIDVTERNRQRQLEQDENTVLNLIGQQTALPDILEAVIRLGERYNTGIRGTVMLADSEGQLLTVAAAPSFSNEFTRLMEHGLPIADGMGSCGTAAFLRQRVTVPDVSSSPLFAFPEGITAMGFHAVFSQPVISSKGQLLGTIAYYSEKQGEPDTETVNRLEWSARMAAIAIERFQSENALKESEKQYRLLVENASDIVYSISNAGVFTYVSPAWEALLGHAAGDVLGHSIAEFLHTDDSAMCFSLIADYDSQEEVLGGLDYRIRHKDGSWRWHRSTVTRVFDADGTLTGFSGIARDITGQKQAEEALRQSESKYRLLVENANDIVYTMLIDGTFTYVSPTWTRILGHDVSEVENHSFTDFVHPDDTARAFQLIQESLLSGQIPSGIEYRVRHQDGSWRWHVTTVSSVMDTDGNFTSFMGIARDVTEKKAGEQALEASEERYRLLAENAKDMVFRVTLQPELSFDYLSPSTKDITGYAPEELIKNPALSIALFHPDEQPLLLDMASSLASFSGKPETSRWVKKDGTTIWVEMQLTIIRDDTEHITAIEGIIRDVTERMRGEAQITKNQQHLSMLLDLHRSAGLPEKEIMRHALQVSEEALQSKFALIGLTSATEKVMQIHECSRNVMQECAMTDTAPVHFSMADDGLWAQIMEQRQPLVVNDYPGYSKKRGCPEGHVAIKRFLGVPIFEGDTIVAIGAVANKEEPYDEWDENALTSLLHEMWNLIEQKRRQDRIVNLSRILGSIRNINQLIVREKNPQVLIEKACEMLVETRGSSGAIVILAGPDGKPGAYAQSGFNEAFKQMARQLKRGKLPPCCGKSIDAASEYLQPEKEENCAACPLRSSEGHSQSLWLPLRVGDKLFGHLIASSPASIHHDDEERNLLEEIAGDIAFGLHSIEQERLRRESEEKFALAFEASPDAIAIFNQENGTFLAVNDAYCAITGYSREELLGTNILDLDIWLSEENKNKVNQATKKRERFTGREGVFRTKTGEVKVWLTSNEYITLNGKPCILSVHTDITKLREAERAMRESEERFSIAFKASPDAMSIARFNSGAFIEVNDAYCRNTGYTREELVGKTGHDIHLWADENEAQEIIELLRAGQSIHGREINIRTKQGELRTWMTSLEFVTIGGETCILSVEADVTEKRKAEEAIRESEHRFAIAFEASPDAISIARVRDGEFLAVNDAYCRISGYTREELIGSNASILDMWDSPEQEKEIVETLQRGEKFTGREFAFRRKNGERWVWLTSNEFVTLNGEPCILTVNTDITERRKAEAAAAAEAERRRILMDRSGDGIVVLDEDGRVSDANTRFAEMLGYTLEELQGLHVWDWECNYSKKRLLQMITELRTNDHVESTHKRKDGTTYDVEMNNNAALIDGKKYVFCICRDVTEKKAQEQALRESEEMFSTIFQTSPDHMVIMDAETHEYVEVNDAFCRVTGYSREELIGNTEEKLKIFFGEAEHSKFEKLIETQGKVRNQIYHFRTKSGEIRTWLCSTDFITIKGRRCSLGVAVDITERQKAELALIESEEKFAAAFNSSPTAMTLTDENGIYVDVNDAYCRMSGRKREDVIGRSLAEIEKWVYPEEETRVANRMIKEGRLTDEECHTFTISGEIRTMLLSMEPTMIGGRRFILSTAADITDRKKSELALAESEEKFAASFNSSPNSMLLIGEDGIYIDANDAFFRASGRKREDVIGRKREELLIWVYPEEKEKIAIKLETEGRVKDEECHVFNGAGEIRTTLLSMEPLMIGGKRCTLAASTDITERKAIEEQLRVSDTALKSIHDGIIVMDSEFNILQWNHVCENLFGLSQAEAFGRQVSDVMKILEDYPGQNDERWRILFERGYNREEQRYTTPRGEIWLDVHCQAITINDERTGWITLFVDITERKQGEERLSVSDAALKSIRDAVIIMDNTFNVQQLNSIAEEMFGVKASEIIGRPLGDFLSMEEQKPGENETRWKLLLERGYNREELVYHTPKGTLWADVRVQEIVRNGERIGWVTLVMDITAQKQAQEKLEAAYNKEKELRRSLEKEAKKRLEFSHALVHELKTPLTPIMASSELLMTGLQEEPWLSMAKNIFRGGENLSKRIDELLDLARGEIGMLKVSLSSFSPTELLNQIISEMTPASQQRNQELTADIPATLPMIKADMVRLRQVVANLISNACKFTGDGGKIHLSARRDGDNLQVEVSDNGMGLSEAEQAKLFQAYERGEADRQRLSGLGLGLVLSKNLIELHGGKIWVKSQKGKGSTFTFFIPIDGPHHKNVIENDETGETGGR